MSVAPAGPSRFLDLEAQDDDDEEDLEAAELEGSADVLESFLDDDDEIDGTIAHTVALGMMKVHPSNAQESRILLRRAARERSPSSPAAVHSSPTPPRHSSPELHVQAKSCYSHPPQPNSSVEGFSLLSIIPDEEEITGIALNPGCHILRYHAQYGMANIAKNKLAEMAIPSPHPAEDIDLEDTFEAARHTVVEQCRPEHFIDAVWINKDTAKFHSLYVFTTAPQVAVVLRWFNDHLPHLLLTNEPHFIEDFSERKTLLANFYGSPRRQRTTDWVTIKGGRYNGDAGLMMGRGLWVDVMVVPRLDVDWQLLKSTSKLNENGKRVLPRTLPRFSSNHRPPLKLFPWTEFTVSHTKPSLNVKTLKAQYYREFPNIRFAGPFLLLACRRDTLTKAATIRADIRHLFLSANHPIAEYCVRKPTATYPDHPVLPPVSHWSLEASELVRDRVTGLQGRVVAVLPMGKIAINEHLVDVRWQQVYKVFDVGDFVSISSALESSKTGWVISAGTEEEIKEDVAAVVSRQKALVAQRPQEFKPSYIWTDQQQQRVIRLRQKSLHILCHQRHHSGETSTEFFYVHKNSCTKIQPDIFKPSSTFASHGAADKEVKSLARPPEICLGTQLQMRFLKAQAEDASSGLKYPNSDKVGAPPTVVRSFPKFVLSPGYYTGREPWLNRPVVIQRGEFKGRKGNVSAVTLHNWHSNAASALKANSNSLVRADQGSMKRNESWLWVHVTLHTGGQFNKHVVIVKYEHVADERTLAPLRIARPLTALHVQAGYIGNRAYYVKEASELAGQVLKVKKTRPATALQVLRSQQTASTSSPRQTTPAPSPSPTPPAPDGAWYAKDFLVGWDLRVLNSKSKAKRPEAISVRVQRLPSGEIELFRTTAHGVQSKPLNGEDYLPVHPGKFPNIKCRWVCYRGQHQGTFVRGIRVEHRVETTPFQILSEDVFNWYSLVVTPRRGEKDVELPDQLSANDEDLVVMADDEATLAANVEYSTRKEGSRDGGRGRTALRVEGSPASGLYVAQGTSTRVCILRKPTDAWCPGTRTDPADRVCKTVLESSPGSRTDPADRVDLPPALLPISAGGRLFYASLDNIHAHAFPDTMSTADTMSAADTTSTALTTSTAKLYYNHTITARIWGHWKGDSKTTIGGVALRDAAAQYEADFGGRARIFALMPSYFHYSPAESTDSLPLKHLTIRVYGADGFAIGCVEWAGPEREKSKRWVYDEETVNKYRWACWDVEEDLREAKHFFVPGCYYKYLPYTGPKALTWSKAFNRSLALQSPQTLVSFKYVAMGRSAKRKSTKASKSRLTDSGEPFQSRLQFKSKGKQLRANIESNRTVTLIFYLAHHARRTVHLANVGRYVTLGDHWIELFQHHILPRPNVRILPTEGLSVLAADSWRTIMWTGGLIPVPRNPNKPVFVHATNDALPEDWMVDIGQFLEPL
ncbi:hypothetical protein BDZ89DRAFT_1042074 [Hymenopellis radicata]|nr:hypothetical protein BDZ89DRAFT_1042074 [Hymenopellis radicata]